MSRFHVPSVVLPGAKQAIPTGRRTGSAARGRPHRRMLKFGTEYVSRSLAEYEAEVREKLERGLRRKARALGYELVAVAPASPPPS